MDCCGDTASDREFDAVVARRELARFRRRGPKPWTKQLVDAIGSAAVPAGSTLLDIGGGVGAIHHRLLERGFAQATHLDASEAFLAVAAGEATRLGHSGRVVFRHGDFHALAKDLPRADVVTLDRVVCCDPDYEGMLREAAAH